MSVPEHKVEHAHHEITFLRKYIFSEDHKIIGIQFLFTSIIFLGLGGILALLVRIQLAWPHAEIPFIRDFFVDNGGRITETAYNMLFSMHASVMIFFVIIPFLTGAFGNFTIPLMIGARDMAFPKLNMMSYWVLWPGFVVIRPVVLRRGRRRLRRAGPAIRRCPASPCPPARASSRRPPPIRATGRSCGSSPCSASASRR